MTDKKDKHELECPFRDDITSIKNITEMVKKIAIRQDDMFNKLFVQNGNNDGRDCMVVQVQKNTKARERTELNKSSERRNKWRRRGFYATLAGIFLSNIWMVLNKFL
jgi:hypothetical protein